MRKARLLTAEELLHDRLGAHVYEERRGREELRLLIKVDYDGNWASEGLAFLSPLLECHQSKVVIRDKNCRYWRGVPSLTLRRINIW